VLRRLSGKVICASIKKEAAGYFLRHAQVGVAVSSGAEGMTYAARRVVGDWRADDTRGKVFFKGDFKNAFNMADRTQMLAACAAEMPQVLRYAVCAYGTPSHLLYGDMFLRSQSGVHQGDPLGPLLFSLAVAKLWRAVRAELAAAGHVLDFQSWYLDDGAFGGSVAAVAAAVEGIARLGPHFGIHLNPAKCELIGHPEEAAAIATAFGGGFKSVSWCDWSLLGTPCGDDASVSAFLVKVADNACRKTKLVAALPSAHVTFALLRYCCGFSLGVYYMRSCGTDPAFNRIDEATVAAFAQLVPGADAASCEAQVALPTNMSGVGLRPLLPYAPLAYIAASQQATLLLPYVLANPSALSPDSKLAAALLSVSAIPSPALHASVAEYLHAGARPGDHKQRTFSRMLDTELAKVWFDTLPIEGRARAVSCSMSTSHAWMLPRPFEDEVESWMTTAQFQVLMRLRLGLALYPEECDPEAAAAAPSRLCNLCGVHQASSRHSLVCLGGGLRTAYHNAHRDQYYCMASTALLAPRKEVQCFAGEHAYRADVVVTNRRRVLALDFSMSHVGSPNAFLKAASSPGGWADEVARRKRVKYEDMAAEAGIDFATVCWDHYGAVCPSGQQVLRALGRAWGNQFDLPPCRSVPITMQRFATIHARGVAQLILSNYPAG
jgi:hypothetical protein